MLIFATICIILILNFILEEKKNIIIVFQNFKKNYYFQNYFSDNLFRLKRNRRGKKILINFYFFYSSQYYKVKIIVYKLNVYIAFLLLEIWGQIKVFLNRLAYEMISVKKKKISSWIYFLYPSLSNSSLFQHAIKGIKTKKKIINWVDVN